MTSIATADETTRWLFSALQAFYNEGHSEDVAFSPYFFDISKYESISGCLFAMAREGGAKRTELWGRAVIGCLGRFNFQTDDIQIYGILVLLSRQLNLPDAAHIIASRVRELNYQNASESTRRKVIVGLLEMVSTMAGPYRNDYRLAIETIIEDGILELIPDLATSIFIAWCRIAPEQWPIAAVRLDNYICQMHEARPLSEIEFARFGIEFVRAIGAYEVKKNSRLILHTSWLRSAVMGQPKSPYAIVERYEAPVQTSRRKERGVAYGIKSNLFPGMELFHEEFSVDDDPELPLGVKVVQDINIRNTIEALELKVKPSIGAFAAFIYNPSKESARAALIGD